jgi:flagellar basal body-associated protein FliL
MAEEEKAKEQPQPAAATETKAEAKPEAAPEAKPESGEKKSFIGKFMPWIIMAVIVVVSAGTGAGLAKLFAGGKKAAQPHQADKKPAASEAAELIVSGGQKSWYYDMDPVIANLNEPSVTRYVRITITLEISEKVDAVKGKVFIGEKKPELTNWLNIYLSSQTVEDIRGDKNLRRIQAQILNAFNEKLFPNGQGGIKQVLFKEFAVQ